MFENSRRDAPAAFFNIWKFISQIVGRDPWARLRDHGSRLQFL